MCISGASPSAFGQRDEVLCAERVGVERLVERRVEVDDAGDVDDRVDRPLELVRGLVDAAERKADVAVDRDDLAPSDEGVERRRRAGARSGSSASLVAIDLGPEALLAPSPSRFLRTRR